MRNFDIENSILNQSIIRGNTHLYSFDGAMRLIDLCEKNKIPVLGIDSFKVTENTTQPFWEHSVDFSEKKDSYALARSFLISKKEYDFVFEVVY